MNLEISQETNNRILAAAAKHNLNLPLPRGGPCLYSLSSEACDQIKELLQPFQNVDKSVQVLLEELGNDEH